MTRMKDPQSAREERELLRRLDQSPRDLTAVVTTCLAALSAILAVISAVLPNQAASVTISAEISHTGAMELTFKKPLAETTSPACGCLREDPPGGWQGIVMPARLLTFGRTSDGLPTQYDMFNPSPAQWAHLPDSRGMDARIGRVLVPTSTEPTRRAIQNAMAQAPKAFHRETIDVLSITTPGVLSMASLGREPVAALGFPSGTAAHIEYQASQARRDATLARIVHEAA